MRLPSASLTEAISLAAAHVLDVLVQLRAALEQRLAACP